MKRSTCLLLVALLMTAVFASIPVLYLVNVIPELIVLALPIFAAAALWLLAKSIKARQREFRIEASKAMRDFFACLMGLAVFFLGVDRAAAGWYYSATPRVGYSAYYGYSGYWKQYEEPKVVVAAFVQPLYVPTVFSTYQPTAVTTYQTAQLTTVQQLVAVQPAQAVQVRTTQTGVAAQQATDCHTKLTEFEQRMARMEALLQQAIKQPGAAPAPQANQRKPTTGLDVMILRCAGCHDKTVADTKGGKLVYFESGKLLDLDARQINGFYRSLLSGKMPKDAKLEEGEGALIMQHLDTLVAKE